MEELTRKKQNFEKAYATLKSAFDYFTRLKKHEFAHLAQAFKQDGIDYEEELLRARDAMIQRFEYTLEVFWKCLKVSLEIKSGSLELSGSKNVVREAVHVKLVTEAEGILLFKMIDARNLTSHLYRLEVAQLIEAEMPGFINIMQAISSRC